MERQYVMVTKNGNETSGSEFSEFSESHEVSSTELQRKLGEVVDRVIIGRERLVITVRGRPQFAIVPISKEELDERLSKARLAVQIAEQKRT